VTITGPAYGEHDIAIVPLTEADWPAVAAIYAAGIATGHATFETEPPTWEEFDRTRLPDQRHIALDGAGTILGWTAASAVSDLCAYTGVVEHALYVHPGAQGRGVGKRLLGALVESTEAAGVWTIQSGVFIENKASLHAHRAHGFKIVGPRRRLGKMTYGPMEGQWRDVMLIERRSDVAGT
jgi:L-amino acid N-acyltransferase YncA